jgi:hypothetical protein
VIDNAFTRAKSQDRRDILKQKQKDNEEEMGRTVFVTPFHPSLLSMPYILREGIKSLKGVDETFDAMFERPPIVAWNRGPTLKQAFAPSRLNTGERKKPGTRKCDRKSCSACLDVFETDTLTINNFKRKIIGDNNCSSKWVIYGLVCTECHVWYVGKTFNEFKVRWSVHKSVIKKALRDRLAGTHADRTGDANNDSIHYLIKHFCDKHVDISSLKWTIFHCIGKNKKDPSGNLLKWEHAYIDGFGTVWPRGLNCLN